MKATVFLLLDAFRWDYLDEQTTPFLKSCAEKGHHVERIIPSFGFCERAEILTGKRPSETGYFTAIGYDPARSAYKGLKFLLGILGFTERLIPSTFYSKAVRKVLNMYVKKHPHRMKPYRIPLSLLPQFALTEDYYDHRDPRAFEDPTLLSLLEERGQTYFYDSFTALNFAYGSNDEERLKTALDAAKDDHALYLVFNSVPDAYGHHYGGDAPETKAALRKMDDMLKEFVDEFEKRRPGSNYVFTGDHGMVDVQRRFDLESILLSKTKSAKLKLGKDYTYFLDSTLCRIWLLTEKATERLPALIEKDEQFLSHGKFVDAELAKREHVPHGDSRYGDMLWWADPGVLIFPDFFHRRGEEVKGMHGYDPKHLSSQGICIVAGANQQPMVTPELPLTAVFDLLKDCISDQK